MSGYMKHFTALESRLTKSQETFTVRGKRRRPVPVLVPADVFPLMVLFADDEVRKRFGVKESCDLFAKCGSTTSPNKGKSYILIHVLTGHDIKGVLGRC